jgi:hypothetical protein
MTLLIVVALILKVGGVNVPMATFPCGKVPVMTWFREAMFPEPEA